MSSSARWVGTHCDQSTGRHTLRSFSPPSSAKSRTGSPRCSRWPARAQTRSGSTGVKERLDYCAACVIPARHAGAVAYRADPMTTHAHLGVPFREKSRHALCSVGGDFLRSALCRPCTGSSTKQLSTPPTSTLKIPEPPPSVSCRCSRGHTQASCHFLGKRAGHK